MTSDDPTLWETGGRLEPGAGRHGKALDEVLAARPMGDRWQSAIMLARSAVHALDVAERKNDLGAIATALRNARQALLDLQLVPDPDTPILPGDESGEDLFNDVSDAEISHAPQS